MKDAYYTDISAIGNVHHLKTWPEPFQAILDGRKTFEYRKDDRGFEKGDLLLLREWVPECDDQCPAGRYTGREVRFRVDYMLRGPQFGIPEGYCIISLLTTRKGCF